MLRSSSPFPGPSIHPSYHHRITYLSHTFSGFLSWNLYTLVVSWFPVIACGLLLDWQSIILVFDLDGVVARLYNAFFFCNVDG